MREGLKFRQGFATRSAHMKLNLSRRIARTTEMPNPSQYVQMLNGEYAEWAFNEQRALQFKGKWRAEVFKTEGRSAMDLEIGTGNGLFFAHHAVAHPERQLVGLEIKFKPLIQSIRRAVRLGARNARIARFHAAMITDLFAPGELDDVFIFFPDPWPRTRSFKHRLIQDEFLPKLFELQRPGSHLIFKTDHRGYYEWALEKFQRSPYQVLEHTDDLHGSPFAEQNFMTQFEKLWVSKGLKINFIHLLRT